MPKRNYAGEYKNYQGKPAQIKRRASRNAARRKMIVAGKARKGDGKDIAHRNNNPTDNRSKNLGVQSKAKNRSFARTRTAHRLTKNNK